MNKMLFQTPTFKNVLLLVVSILTAFFLAEIFLRWYFPQDMSGTWSELSACKNRVNRSKGQCKHLNPETKQYVMYHFSKFHLRDTPINSLATPILVLGDSFTFGWFLSPEETSVYKLQEKSDKTFGKNQYQFLNAAAPGWGTAHALAYLEEFGEQIAPKFVLIFLNTDDISRSLRMKLYELKDNNSVELRSVSTPCHFSYFKKFLASSAGNFLFEHSEVLQLLRQASRKLLCFNPYFNFRFGTEVISKQRDGKNIIVKLDPELNFKDEEALRYAEALFLRINQWCQIHHAKLLVVTTGFNAFIPSNIHDATALFLSHAPLFFKNNHIAFFDIAPSFASHVENKIFQIRNDCHPNQCGTAAIAEVSWPWVESQIKSSLRNSNF